MTVEQSVLQQHCEKQHQQTLLKQLREITGSTDVRLLQQALQVSNGDLGEAVAFLTERKGEPPQQNEATYYQTAQIGNDRHVSAGSQAHTNVIDLTGDDKEDLQRAIALSLEESSRTFRETGITDEEQAISRVLEASIAENKASLMSTHVEMWSDPPNPHDRKRQENCPVGLKNVGNTCWFSAVIQSLFHLLEFQRLVLQYSPPAHSHDLPCNQKEPRNLLFMQELRHLFSLMVGSKRRYVDPSRAVEILKGAFKSCDSQQQQDVSEFSHKLLDWLEDAFQMKAEGEREGEQPKNPMVELFYGRFVAVGVVEGKKFKNTETFGQYPLQVNGYKDLHESLEAAMIEGEIESLHSEKPAVSGKEHWFAELPPVLTFELSRFQFNQALGRPEKIHNKLEFPAVLYLDRYLDRNMDITRMKRQEMKRLKEHLTLLQQRLERYLSYGSGPKKCPLADVLEYTMEFASSQPILSSLVRHVDMAGTQPGSTTAPSMADQSPPSSSEASTGTPLPQQRVLVHKPLTHSRVLANTLGHPAPRHITEEELRVLEACLQRWRVEVEKDTRELQRCISRIHTTMELMYSDKALMQVPYRLHAVLVHEGQASAGHYWAYIFSPQLQRWLKFNDVSVTKSSWDELVRDSFGGYRNASAYCLMYVNDKKPFLIQEEFDKETGQVLSALDKLPADLKEYANKDNQLFEKELQEWDALQAHRETVEKLASAMAVATTASGSMQPCPPESTTCQQEPEYMEASVAGDQERRREDTERAVSQVTAEQAQCSPEGLLNALTSESPSSNFLSKVLVNQAFKMVTTPQPKNKDSLSSLHVIEGSTTYRAADRCRAEATVTPLSVDSPKLSGSDLPVLSIQVGVNKKNTMEIFVQGTVKESTPLGRSGQPVGSSQALPPHGTLNGSITVPSHAHTVVESLICRSSQDKPKAERSTTLPPPVKPVTESIEITPTPFQVVSEGMEVTPLPVKPAIEGAEAPPPTIKPVPECAEIPPIPFQVVSEGMKATPLSIKPVIEDSEAPPSPIKPVAESTEAPPSPFQGVSEGNEVPPPPVKLLVENCKVLPLPVKVVPEVSKVSASSVKFMTEGAEVPTPLAQPVTERPKVLPTLWQHITECPKAPPPPVASETHAFTTPLGPVQPVTEGAQAPATLGKPEAGVCKTPSPGVQPTTEHCKAPALPVQSMTEGFVAPCPPAQHVGEGAIPCTGTSTWLQENNYDDDEAMLTPSMQSVIRAIGKAWSVYDKCGPEAAFFKAIKVEYGRLLWLAREETSPEKDPRLLYVMVYLIKNQAPKKILERTLLMQFADCSLSFNERCKNIMKVAQEKLHLIRPDEVNLEEYQTWHQDYQTFRETTVFLMIGLELFQKESYVEALMYLIYSYQYNKTLLSKGPYRGHDKELIAHYRRECLLRLNKRAAALFQSGEEPELSDGLTIMNELVVPCLPLLLLEEEEKDTAAVEEIRNRWCSYLGQEMEPKLQETLTDFLPKLLDCSAETRSFRDPPRLPSLSTLELCERFSQVLTSLGLTPVKER